MSPHSARLAVPTQATPTTLRAQRAIKRTKETTLPPKLSKRAQLAMKTVTVTFFMHDEEAGSWKKKRRKFTREWTPGEDDVIDVTAFDEAL